MQCTTQFRLGLTMQSLSRMVHRTVSLAIIVLLASVSSARGAALELYEIGDIGTASAGQAALAEDASTAAKNPAG
jgi:long-subunit fatty acid transport protein